MFAVAFLLCSFAGMRTSAEPAARTAGTAQEAYAVFARSCSSCHSERLRRPKGDFGFVLDLRRLARAGEYVVRGQPDASGLLQVIDDGSMPPPRSRLAALTAKERQAVHDWILDGAPPGPIDPSLIPSLPEVEETSAAVGYTGHLHPLLVHFPIGLLFAAALAEVLFIVSRGQRFRSTAEYCLVLGTAGACTATITGWFLATELDYTMTIHRWLGVATNLFALAACRLALSAGRLPAAPTSRRSTLLYRAAFAATILLLVVTSHLGATATGPSSILSW